MNPVRAGLVEREEQWPWSSRSALALPDLGGRNFDPWPAGIVKTGRPKSSGRTALTLSEIGDAVCRKMEISIFDLRARSKRRRMVEARSQFVRASVRAGYKLVEAAVWLECTARMAGYYLTRNPRNC